MNKKKIINDPVHGFINIPSELIFDIIEHSYFQRLRRIKQLGLTYYVYPGATHTRFHHVLGATYLMSQAIDVLRNKGVDITADEAEGALIAILLHDIGHGPFSHTLEHSFVENISHEAISLKFMNKLNSLFEGRLQTGIDIFENTYPKKFLHQLVSSQLDMDRLDYLRRDSFFTGVVEGTVNSDRLIKMLNVLNDELVVDSKGIYSVEKFLIARRLMYWQVYLHKTVVVAEQILIKILKRAKLIRRQHPDLFATPALQFFLYHDINSIEQFDEIDSGTLILDHFNNLDDTDVMASIKIWKNHPDKILSYLCDCLINRKLFKIEIFSEQSDIPIGYLNELKQKAIIKFGLTNEDADYLVFSDVISNNAYTRNSDHVINILFSSGKLIDVAQASDISNVKVLSKTVKKYFICYPKDI